MLSQPPSNPSKNLVHGRLRAGASSFASEDRGSAARQTTKLEASALLVLTLAASGCGLWAARRAPAPGVAIGGGDAPAASPARGGAPPPAAEGPAKPWADMTYDEREWYMTTKVQPVAHALFRDFDPGRYRVFDCTPCHGRDGEEKHYKMPSQHLRPLPPLGSEGFAALLETDEGQFMAEVVTPKTAALLGLPLYDPAMRRGFSCFGCHPEE